MVINVKPGGPPELPFPKTVMAELQTSARHLFAQVESFRERERIIAILNKEQVRSEQSYITYDRLMNLISDR